MKIIDNSSPITFGMRFEGECFKSEEFPNEIFMKIPPITMENGYHVNAINLQTGEATFWDDEDDLVIPVKTTVTIENY